MEDKTHVNLVFFGPCGCGKSTTAGHLIADCGAIDGRSLERISREAAAHDREDRRYAWILDKLRCERERGNTMYVGLWRLASQRCRFTIIDAPGHNDFIKDIVTAMSQADIAVLVVSASQEDSSVGEACWGQILREHALLAYTLGLRQLVVCVNKMDSEAVGYSQEQFESACAMLCADLNSVGLQTHDMHFVPTSGWLGDNVVYRSANTPWYCGPTLLEALDDVVASYFKPSRPLRLPIHDVMQIGGSGVVAAGRVATGSLRPGMSLVLAPGHVRAEVLSLKMHHEVLDEAVCGDSVDVVVNVPRQEIHRGQVASAEDDSPARECSSFLAQVIVLSPPRAGEIAAGCVLAVECHTTQVPCQFEELLSRTDRRTGQVLELAPAALCAGDAAVVRLRPQAPMCVEPFSDYPALGRFAVRDQKTTVAVGVVQQVEHVMEPQWMLAAKPSPKTRSKHSVASKPKTGRAAVARPLASRLSGSRGEHQVMCAMNTDDSDKDSPEMFPHAAIDSDLVVPAAKLAVRPCDDAISDFGAFNTTFGNAFGGAFGDAFGSAFHRAHEKGGGYPAEAVNSNPSPFAAFGAVTRNKAREAPFGRVSKTPPTLVSADSGDGGEVSEVFVFSDG
mmetsp:Transcript_39019/g.64292  ORF Transcript_39019/g.64292 Transcript_39019/m.64292 type:complete len:619 (+) Transcript_39019:179-2035(+)